MRKLIFLWIALVVVSLQALANDKVSFTASAPDAVAVGDQFRLAYTVTTQKVRDFRAPSIKGFDVLMGPSRSQQSSMQIVNGVSTSTSSITFTYILMATTEGTLTGTPMTGSVVLAAMTPGRAAAMPAAAIITLTPRPRAFFAKSSTASGVRCAERAFISNGTCKSFSS